MNWVTHGIGTGLAVVGLTVLLVMAAVQGDGLRLFSFAVYGATLVLLYLASTLYHSLRNPRWKAIFHVLDHVSIYLLIAGTYTPFALVILKGLGGWILFGVVWGLALVGVVFKVFWVNRFRILSTTTYLIMGWLAIFVLEELIAGLSLGGLVWVLSGGIMYTVGVIFFMWERLPYSHAIWHLFVMIGSICHYLAILFYVLPTT